MIIFLRIANISQELTISLLFLFLAGCIKRCKGFVVFHPPSSLLFLKPIQIVSSLKHLRWFSIWNEILKVFF